MTRVYLDGEIALCKSPDEFRWLEITMSDGSIVNIGIELAAKITAAARMAAKHVKSLDCVPNSSMEAAHGG